MRWPPSKTIQIKCSECMLGHFCFSAQLDSSDVLLLDALAKERVHLKRDEVLYRQGDVMNSLFSVRFGALKTEISIQSGQHQVLGFHLAGEIIGLDGIGEDRYQTNAIALEDSEVCIIPFDEFEDLAQRVPALQHQFRRIVGKELNQDKRHLLSLGSLPAERKLALFILNLDQRAKARGAVNHEFEFKMSRADIGSFLGITIETVSRLVKRFSEAGLIQIKQRSIKIIDIGGLHELAGELN